MTIIAFLFFFLFYVSFLLPIVIVSGVLQLLSNDLAIVVIVVINVSCDFFRYIFLLIPLLIFFLLIADATWSGFCFWFS